MKKIRCIITDDEPVARKGLREYVEKIDFLELAGECKGAVELNAILKTTPVDLVFLDIEMPHLSGIDFLAGLSDPPKVIIVSAYEQYAIKGYELAVTDYLLKPVSFDRFLKAVNRVYDQFNKEQKSDLHNDIFVKSDGQLKKVRLNDIRYIESMENYIVIHTRSEKETVYMTLKQILGALPAEEFLQVHRSYIVNIKHIEAIDGNQLVIAGHHIPVARNERETVFNTLLQDRIIQKK